jgi:hypothetical protein
MMGMLRRLDEGLNGEEMGFDDDHEDNDGEEVMGDISLMTSRRRAVFVGLRDEQGLGREYLFCLERWMAGLARSGLFGRIFHSLLGSQF